MIRIADKNATSDHLIVCDSRDLDPEVELFFEQSRHFDPTVGRWLSDEPAAFQAGGDYRCARNRSEQAATVLNSRSNEADRAGGSTSNNHHPSAVYNGGEL